MKFTNRHNLPSVFEKIYINNEYQSKPNSFGATTLLAPVQEIIFKKRYGDLLLEDLSDRIPALIGTAVHDYLERNDDEEYVEMYLNHEILNDMFVSGKIDKYIKDEFTLVDYKTAKVNKIVYEDFDDWKMQGLIYAWLLLKKNLIVEKIRFIAILKDWSKFARANNYSNDKYYPDSPIFVYEFKVNSYDLNYIDEYITNKMKQIRDWKDLPDEELLKKPIEERWQPKITYAVIGEGKNRARKIFQDRNQAFENLKEDEIIEERIESPSKLDMYCPAYNYAKEKILKEKYESEI